MWTAQKLLEELARSRDAIPLKTLHARGSATSRAALINAIQVLKRRGLATIAQPGHYRITEDGRKHLIAAVAIRSGSHAPKPRTTTSGLRKRAWWLIRKQKKVTIPDLLGTLATGQEKAAANNLRKYLRQLTRAGILTELKRRPGGPKTSNGHKCWLLINDPGPLPPVWRQKDRCLYDPNSGKTHALTEDGSHA